MIKLIVSDIDETLVKTDQTIHQRNLDAIKKAQDMGIIFMVASGRGPYQLENVLKDTKIEIEDRFSVLCNGGLIMENHSKKIVDSNPVAFKKAKRVYDYCFERSLECQIYTDQACYILREDKKIPDISYKDTVFLDHNNIDFLKDQIIIKTIIKSTNLNFLMSLEPDVAELCERDVAISYSSDKYMEINAKGVNKAKAIEKLCNYYKIDKSEVMTIGDNYNDIEMLAFAGKSVAVQNAHLQVKETADYITIANHNEGAVGEAIEKFILNKKRSI